jgi:hypothetical protein
MVAIKVLRVTPEDTLLMMLLTPNHLMKVNKIHTLMLSGDGGLN